MYRVFYASSRSTDESVSLNRKKRVTPCVRLNGKEIKSSRQTKLSVCGIGVEKK